MYSLVAVPDPNRSNLLDPHPQCRLIVHKTPISMRRTSNTKNFTGPPLTDSKTLLQICHQSPPGGRLYNFFESTSCNIHLSRLRSATICFSLRFSSSNCFRRLSSLMPKP